MTIQLRKFPKFPAPHLCIATLLVFFAGTGTLARAQKPKAAASTQAAPTHAASERLRAQADRDYQQGKRSAALATYLKIYPSYSSVYQVNYRIGWLYLNSPHPNAREALRYLQKAQRLMPNNTDALQTLAQAYTRNGQYEESIGLYKKLIDMLPRVPNYRLDLARTLNWAGKTAESTSAYRDYFKYRPSDMTARVEFGRILTNQKDYQGAEEQYRYVLERQPQNAGARVGSARILAWTGKIQPSLDELEEVLKTSPRNFEARVLKAYDLMWLGHFDESRSLFQTLDEESPHNADVAQGLVALAKAEEAAKTAKAPATAPKSPLLQQAEKYAADANYSQAIALYRQYLEGSPEDSDARFHLAQVLSWNKQFPESEAILVPWVKEHPDSLDGHLQLARVYSWDGKYAQSEEQYNEAITLSPQNFPAQLELGRVLSWDLKYPEAVSQLKKAEAINPQDPSVHLELGRVLSTTKDYAGAIEELRQALNLQPGSAEIQKEMIRTLVANGQTKEAQEELAHLRESHPNDPDIATLSNQLQSQELASLRAQGPQAYQAHLRQLVTEHPNDVRYRLALADAYENAKDFQSAITQLQAAVSMKPDDPSLRLQLARVLSWNAQYPESLQIYRQYLASNPQNTAVELELARVLSWDKNYSSSIKQYQSVIQTNPQNPESRLEAGRVMTWAKQYDQALNQFNTILKNDPKNFDALVGKGRTYASLHEWHESIGALDAALAVRPGDPEALTAKAQTLLWSGKAGEARSILRKLHDEKPNDTVILVSLASAEDSLGRPDRALELLKSAEQISPNNNDALTLDHQIRQRMRPELSLGWSYLRDNQSLNVWRYQLLDFRFNINPRFRAFLTLDVLPTSGRADNFGYPIYQATGPVFGVRVPIEPYIPAPTLLTASDFPSSALLVQGNQRISQFAVQFMGGGTMQVNQWLSWTAGIGAIELRHNPPDLSAAGFPSTSTRFIYTVTPTFRLGPHWQISVGSSRQYWAYTPKSIAETTYADEQTGSITWSPDRRSQITLSGWHREIRPGFQIPQFNIYNSTFTTVIGVYPGRTYKMHGNGGSVSATRAVIRGEKGELILGYEGSVAGYIHPVGLPSPEYFANPGVFTPGFYQRQAGLMRIVLNPSRHFTWDLHGSAGVQQIHQRSNFSLSATAGTRLDFIMGDGGTTLTLGYDYFNTASALQAVAIGRAAAYHSSSVTAGLRFRF